MSIEPITIPMSIESNEVTIESTFDARIEVVEGGSITVQSLTVLSNGTTTAPEGKAYSPVIVNVPASAVDTGTKNINTNGTHDVIGYASASVSVPASAVDTGTKNITSNGNNQDVVGYAKVNVAVPNSYSAGDEGKVVSSGALVSQTSDSTTQNGTFDTTLIDSFTVNVSGGGGGAYASGTVTPTARVQTYTFTAPNCNYFAIFPTTAPSLSTGTAFCASTVGVDGRIYVVRSINNGSGWHGAPNDDVTLSKTGDVFSLRANTTADSNGRVLQIGITYAWCAWS